MTAVSYDDLSSTESLATLSVALRDEGYRNGAEVQNHLDRIVEALTFNLGKDNGSGSDDVKTETLKVLVNLTADSDANRSYLISDDERCIALWESVIGLLTSGSFGVGKLTAIFISQFVTNTTQDRRYVEFLSTRFALLNPMIQFLGAHYVDYGWNADEWTYLVDILAEIMNEYQDIIRSNDEYKNLDCLNILIKILREHLSTSDDTQYLGNLIDCITVLTSFSDFPRIDTIKANIRICKLISRVPSNIKDAVKLKRKLFAVSGNISSMSSFDNFDDVIFSINAIKKQHQFSDPYFLSACLINIGNYIVSKEKRDAVEKEIGDFTEFIEDMFHIHYNDIVQLQALHCLNNVLSPSIAHDVVKQHTAILAVTSMIVANQQYYPEVVRVFIKFLKKLLSLSAGDQAWKLYESSFWSSFDQLLLSTDSEDIQMLALQSYLKVGLEQIEPDLVNQLVSATLSTKPFNSNANVELPFVLAKLKTLSMFNHYVVQNASERIPRYITLPINYIEQVSTIFEVMESMEAQLRRSSGPGNHQLILVFHNAFTFAAATSLNVVSSESFPPSSGPEPTALVEKCKAIVKQKV